MAALVEQAKRGGAPKKAVHRYEFAGVPEACAAFADQQTPPSARRSGERYGARPEKLGTALLWKAQRGEKIAWFYESAGPQATPPGPTVERNRSGKKPMDTWTIDGKHSSRDDEPGLPKIECWTGAGGLKTTTEIAERGQPSRSGITSIGRWTCGGSPLTLEVVVATQEATSTAHSRRSELHSRKYLR